MAKKPAAKKAAKPVKKAAKPAPKKAAKPAPKKAAKPAVKKAVKAPAKKKVVAKPAPKKAVKKAAPAKVTKAPVKKVVAKVPAKKVAPAKAAKPVVPVKAQTKPAPKPVAKAAVPAKPAAKAAPAAKPVETKSIQSPKNEKPVSAPAKPVKKEPTKKEEKAAQKELAKAAASRPLVTQILTPNRPMAAPVVKKQVSTLEHASKLRYSDEELQEFKDLIMRKLEEARKDYDLLKQTLANNDNNGTDDTSPSFKMIEDGSETLSREETAQLASRQEKFIKHLEDAQLRIRNKTYGICRVTGRLISKERLRLVPHATLSIEAKQQMGN